VRLVLDVEEPPARWLLEETDMPETPLHDLCIELLTLILRAWCAREQRDALVTGNLGCRWDPSDARVGADPDVALIEPAPPEGELLRTLRIWEPGHSPPRVVIEVVSTNTAEKDYLDAPARYGRLGARELWVFDPLLQGPGATGGPFLLQLWRRKGEEMARVYAGPGPARSDELGAWLVVTQEGRRLRVADDAAGTSLWPTDAEAHEQGRRRAEAAQRQAEAAQRQAETARRSAEKRAADEALARQSAEQKAADEARAREQADAEVAELRRQLGALRGPR
jgi:Uma2 family endonuclease